jgi:hypothetical protein
MPHSAHSRAYALVARLVASGRQHEALVLLASRAHQAQVAGRHREAADLHGIRASLLLAAGQDSSALRELRAAVRLDPLDGRHHLAIARCEAIASAATVAGLRSARRAIQLFAADHSLHTELPQALGIHGVLVLRLGRTSEALHTLTLALAALRAGLHVGAPDLWLVRECLACGIAPETTRAYLSAVRSWARKQNDTDLLARLKALTHPHQPV